MNIENKKIVLLAGKGPSTNIVFHALNRVYTIHTVIMEEKESKKVFLKRRIKKLGFIKVFGQIIFQLVMVPLLNFISQKKINFLLNENDLDVSDIPHKLIQPVLSINEDAVAMVLIDIKPDVIVVNGTRIITKKILSIVKCPIINMHAGITPGYRGVHGAYWALVNKDKQHCGVTVHLIDAGIDTGDVLYQSLIDVNRSDTFVTYPVKQLAKGIPLLIQAVQEALNGNIKTINPSGKSQLWYHPAIWQYFYYFIINKVK